MGEDAVFALIGNDERDESDRYAKAFELPFEPPDWRNSLGFFLPLPTLKPTEGRAVNFLQLPNLPRREPPNAAIRDLIELLGTGGASSRAVSEWLHKYRTMAPGAALGSGTAAEEEEEEDKVDLDDTTDRETRKLKKQVEKYKKKMAELEAVLTKETEEKQTVLMQQEGLEAQIAELKEDLDKFSSSSGRPRTRTQRIKSKMAQEYDSDEERLPLPDKGSEHKKASKARSAQILRKK